MLSSVLLLTQYVFCEYHVLPDQIGIVTCKAFEHDFFEVVLVMPEATAQL